MNKEILDKIDEIINLIIDSDDYKKYLELKELINNDKKLLMLINEIKLLQKDIVHKIDNKALLKSKMELLNDNPIYREYNNTLYNLNNTYAIIENSLNNYFKRKING